MIHETPTKTLTRLKVGSELYPTGEDPKLMGKATVITMTLTSKENGGGNIN